MIPAADLTTRARELVAELTDFSPCAPSRRRELLNMLRFIKRGVWSADSRGCTWTLAACLEHGLCESDDWKLTELGGEVARLLAEGAT